MSDAEGERVAGEKQDGDEQGGGHKGAPEHLQGHDRISPNVYWREMADIDGFPPF